MENTIPFEALVLVAEIISKEEFSLLGPLMRTDLKFKEVTESIKVLKAANLGGFIFKPENVLKGTKYRRFFVKCLGAGNKFANLLEGVRKAFIEADLEGDWRDGYGTLAKLKWWEDIYNANLIVACFLSSLERMNPPRIGRFFLTFRCPKPICSCTGDNYGACILCFIY